MAIESIRHVIHRLEQQPRWQQNRQFRLIRQRWSQMVGPAVACQAMPVRLDRQILYVAVANPMWAQTLSLERPTILAKIQEQSCIELKDIRFSSGDWFRQVPKSSPAATGSRTSQPTIPDWLRHHPSFVPPAPAPAPEPQTQSLPSASPKPTAVDCFRQWSQRTQQMQHHQPLCPVCGCHCPTGELRRWSRCSVCAAQGFSPQSLTSLHRRLPRG
jgi:predicted nucleic acid-binding Zn ribbon protein